MEPRIDLRAMEDLLLSCGNIFLWKYSAEGELIRSNCPQEAILSKAFDVLGCRDRIVEYGKRHRNPISILTETGLVWYAVFEWNEETLSSIYTIGPVTYGDSADTDLYGIFQNIHHSPVSNEWIIEFKQSMDCVPVVQYTVIMLFAVMLHYCISGEKLQISDVDTEVELKDEVTSEAPSNQDYYMAWSAEQALMQALRNGDLDYKRVFAQCMAFGGGSLFSSVFSKNAVLTRGKMAVSGFVSLARRAAIEGGLSPVEAHKLADFYFQTIAAIENPADLASLAITMYDDFIRRVHKCRMKPQLSREVQQCRDYIETNLGEKLTVKQLSGLVGYSEYYLSKKFSEETGTTLGHYIKTVRIDRAKLLLRSTKLSVDAIAAQLGFGSRGFFSKEFKKLIGMTPVQYRNNVV